MRGEKTNYNERGTDRRCKQCKPPLSMFTAEPPPCLLKSRSTQDGCNKACSAETSGLVGSLAFGCVYSQPDAIASGSTRGLARYISPHLEPDITEPTTQNPTDRMGPVSPLHDLGPRERPQCTISQSLTFRFPDFADIPCRNSGPSSPR